jgi:hypothetical protein
MPEGAEAARDVSPLDTSGTNFIPEKEEKEIQVEVDDYQDIILTSTVTEGEGSERTRYISGFHENYAPARSRGQKILLVGVTIVGMVILLAGIAVGAFFFLSGRGPQPDQAMPSDTIGYVKIDLNPSAGQKINFIRFLSNAIPESSDMHVDATSEDPLGDFLTKSGLFTNGDVEWSEISAWAGDRAALAAVPDKDGLPSPIILVAVDDEVAMTNFFAENAPNTRFAMVRDGYAVIAGEQETVDHVVGAQAWLVDDPAYRTSIEQAGSGQIMSGWLDLNRVNDMQKAVTENLAGGYDEQTVESIPSFTGIVTFGLTVEPDMLDYQVITNNVTINGAPLISPTATTDDLASLPADTVAAFTWADAGGFIAQYIQSDSSLTQSFEDATGLRTSEAVDPLSSVLTVFLLADEANSQIVGARVVETEDSSLSAWIDLLSKVTANDGSLSIANSPNPDGSSYLYMANAENLPLITSEVGSANGTLGQSEAFRKVVPGPSTFAGFVNLTRVWEMMKADDPNAETYDSLTALGTTTGANEDGTGTVTHIRLTFIAPE